MLFGGQKLKAAAAAAAAVQKAVVYSIQTEQNWIFVHTLFFFFFSTLSWVKQSWNTESKHVVGFQKLRAANRIPSVFCFTLFLAKFEKSNI